MKMNSGYGGTQQEMHPTNINQGVGYLDPHEQILGVGGDQHKALQERGDIPFWINPQERVATKFSQCDDTQLKDKTKSELPDNIKSYGKDIYVVKEKRVGQLQYISHKNSISVKNRISE